MSALSTLTEPLRLTATDPEAPALIATAAMLSLLVAVTATPWKPDWLEAETEAGFSAEALAEGSSPFLTMLCERP